MTLAGNGWDGCGGVVEQSPMMWALIATLCIVTGPGRAECRVEVARVERDRIACLEMITPTTELVAQEAAEAGMEVIHIAAACERGPMS